MSLHERKNIESEQFSANVSQYRKYDVGFLARWVEPNISTNSVSPGLLFESRDYAALRWRRSAEYRWNADPVAGVTGMRGLGCLPDLGGEGPGPLGDRVLVHPVRRQVENPWDN